MLSSIRSAGGREDGTAEFTNHISTYKEGVGRDGSPEGFDSNGGTAEFTNDISTDKEDVGRDEWPEDFDSNGTDGSPSGAGATSDALSGTAASTPTIWQLEGAAARAP